MFPSTCDISITIHVPARADGNLQPTRPLCPLFSCGPPVWAPRAPLPPKDQSQPARAPVGGWGQDRICPQNHHGPLRDHHWTCHPASCLCLCPFLFCPAPQERPSCPSTRASQPGPWVGGGGKTGFVPRTTWAPSSCITYMSSRPIPCTHPAPPHAPANCTPDKEEGGGQ